jgi:hypothetical protein
MNIGDNMGVNPAIPAFEPEDVALLISVVEKALEDLRRANEKLGGSDAELLEYGRRYASILQKLNAVIDQVPGHPAL